MPTRIGSFRSYFFGAEVPSLAAGEALKARIEHRLANKPGAPKAELLCHWARTVAELPVDAAGATTGWREATRLPPPVEAPYRP